MFAFERLDAWHRCHELSLAVYRSRKVAEPRAVWAHFTSAPRSCFSGGQHRRGIRQRGPAEFRRYLDISLGSLSELACLLRLAADLGLMQDQERDDLNQVRESASKMTWLLYKSVARAKSSPS